MRMLRRLLSIIAPAWPAMLLATLLALATVAANVGLMSAAAYLISMAALHPPLAALSTAIVGVRFFGLARAVFRYLERYVAHDATFRLLSHIRVWFYRALEPLAPARLAEYRKGDLLGRVIGDVETLQYFYLRVLLPPAVAVLTLLILGLLLPVFGTELAWVTAAGFMGTGVILPLVLYCFGRGAGRRLVESRGSMNAILADSIKGMRELAAFDQTGSQLRRVAVAQEELDGLKGRTACITGLADAGGNLVMNLTLVGVLVLAIAMVRAGCFDGVYLAMLALGVQSSFEAVLPLALLQQYWEESSAAAGRLFAIVDARPTVSEPEGPGGLPEEFGLAVEELTFRYRENLPPVLDGVSFELAAGDRLAVVGPSGAGKSSLASLLVRFWDYEGGSIRLGGREICEYPTAELREIVGVVPQYSHIFTASLEDNIRLARPAATPEEIMAAVEQASLGELVRSLPRGLDTMVGEGGHSLSGGERQRLAIARVLLKRPQVFIFDEPTAGLDAVTEQEVMATIRRATEGKTTILITHRLTGLGATEDVLVLDDGRVVERGGLEELLARRGLCYELWRIQHEVL